MTKRILVIGGGIGGLTLAAALRQRGLDADVIERAPKLAPVGAGITLSINAMSVMRALGLADDVTARGRTLGRMSVSDATGRPLQSMDMQQLAQRFGPSIAIHRARLHEVLASAVDESRARLGITPTAITPAEREVRVQLSDGTVDAWDAVIACDGIRSWVRQQLFDQRPPIYSGYTCWRFVVPNPGLTETVEMWGRGQRFGLVPIGEGLLYAFCTNDAPAGQPDPVEGRVERFHRTFAGFGGDVPKVLQLVTKPEQLIHGDIEEIAIGRMAQGRVALLGDAAHAMTPNLGQGAAMAIEDAWVLARKLAESDDVPAAFLAYERQRTGRVRKVQTMARRLGQLGQWRSGVGDFVRQTVLRLTPDRIAVRNMEQLLIEEPDIAALFEKRAA